MALPAPAGPIQLPAVPAGTFDRPNMGIGDIPSIFGSAMAGEQRGQEQAEALQERRQKILLDEEYKRSLIAQREEATAMRLQQARQWFFDHHENRIGRAWDDVLKTAQDPNVAAEAIWPALNSYHQTIHAAWAQAVAEGYAGSVDEARALMPYQGVTLPAANAMISQKHDYLNARALAENRKQAHEDFMEWSTEQRLTQGEQRIQLLIDKLTKDKPLTIAEGKAEIAAAYEQYGDDISKWPKHYQALYKVYGPHAGKDPTLGVREKVIADINRENVFDPEQKKKWDAMTPQQQELEIQRRFRMYMGPGAPKEQPQVEKPGVPVMDKPGAARIMDPEGQGKPYLAEDLPIGTQWTNAKGIPLAEVRRGPGGKKGWYSLVSKKSSVIPETPAKPPVTEEAPGHIGQGIQQGPGLEPGYEQAPPAASRSPYGTPATVSPNPYLTNP